MTRQKEAEKENSRIIRTAVDLKNITMPVLNIVGNNEDLVSPKSSIPITNSDGNGIINIISSKDKMLMEFPFDHVELCISYGSHKDLWPQVTQWIKERS